jgi:hypothetical protein
MRVGRVALLHTFVTAVFAVSGCGGETIDRTSTGHSPPTKAGHDAGGGDKDAGSDGGTKPPLSIDFERPVSGTRLTVIEPYDPARPTLWDQEKNVQCRPQLATDGTMRCLPDAAGGVIFSDSLCKHPVVTPGPSACGDSLAYYVDIASAGQCATGKTTVYTAGAPIDTPESVYPHNDVVCSLLDKTINVSGPFYEAVPFDPTGWVLFTDEVVPVTDELGVRVWIGADDSQLPHGLELLASKTPCDAYPSSPQDLPPSPTWCIPTLRARPGDGFPTDQCDGDQLAGACAPTDVIDAKGDLFETGAQVSPIFFQNPNEGGKCMTLPPLFTSAPNPSVFYRTGPLFQRDQYPTLALSRQGSGRVQAEYWTSGGKNLFVVSYVDTKYNGERCTPTQLASGGTWCVVGAVSFAPGLLYNRYADPECTRPVAIAAGRPIGYTGEPLALVYPSGHTCTSWGLPTVHSLAQYLGPTFEFSSPGVCQPSQASYPGEQLLEPGPQIDPSVAYAEVPQ